MILKIDEISLYSFHCDLNCLVFTIMFDIQRIIHALFHITPCITPRFHLLKAQGLILVEGWYRVNRKMQCIIIFIPYWVITYWRHLKYDSIQLRHNNAWITSEVVLWCILKGKYQRNSAKGVTRIDISLAGSVSAVKADMCIVKQAVFLY